MIYEKTRDGEVLYDVFSRLIKDRIVFLSGSEGIDCETAVTTSATLLFLDHQSKTKPISIYINSPGGTVTDGLYTIYDTMQSIQAPIKTVCMGQACSAAAVILGAGTKGMRYAFENAEIMIHQLQIGGGEQYKPASEVIKESARIKRLNDKILKTIADHSGQSFEKVKNDVTDDFYMTAQEALEYGLIDGLIKKTKTVSTPKKVMGRRRKS